MDGGGKAGRDAFIAGIKELIQQVSRGNKKQFARALGVNYDTVRSWCAGEYLPGGDTLILLHEKYKISLDRLLLGIDPGAAFMNDWPADVRHTCARVKKILTEGDSDMALALHTEINALTRSLEKDMEKRKLEHDLEKLKAVVRVLRRQKKESTDKE